MADEKIEEDETVMATEEEIEGAFGNTGAGTPLGGDLPPQPAQTATYEEEFTPSIQMRLGIGSMRDRVAAGIIDLLFLGYFYGFTLVVYNHFLKGMNFSLMIPLKGNHSIAFHAIFGLVFYLYFLISEVVFFTSLGKFFCRLSVRNTSGGAASIPATAIRNFFRPIDYLLLFFPTWLLMEKTRNHQRLGDLIAGTVVTKHLLHSPQRLPVEGFTASASVRCAIGLVDLTFLILWIGGFLLWIDAKRPIFNLLILAAIPPLYFLWNLVWEGLFQSTIGQWIFACRMAREDGSPVRFAESLTRSIFRPFDITSFFTLFLSNKNQTASDLAAGVVVVHSRRSLGTVIGMAVTLMILVPVWFGGLGNPGNFLNTSLKLNLFQDFFSINIGGGAREDTTTGLMVKRFSFLEKEGNIPRGSAEFEAGETVHFSFDITDFVIRDKKAWIQEDLTVRYPNNTIGFQKENIVDFHQTVQNPEVPLEILNKLSLPPDAQPGHYTVVLVLHDRYANRHLTEQRTFRVK